MFFLLLLFVPPPFGDFQVFKFFSKDGQRMMMTTSTMTAMATMTAMMTTATMTQMTIKKTTKMTTIPQILTQRGTASLFSFFFL